MGLNQWLPEYVKRVLERLAESGYSAYCVGGCVRDAIMQRPVHDWDVATSAQPFEITRLFPKTAMTGERFGTVTIISHEGLVEVTTYRTEGGYKDARHPDSVEFLSDIEGDLRRRDFTINAIAASISGEIVDLFGGCVDIGNRIIRCVGDPVERFREDALRMFRAFRFKAELDFEVEQVTLGAITENASIARRISVERIRVELEKTLLSHKPEIAGEIIEAGLLDKYLIIDKPKSCIQFTVLERIARLPSEPALRWSAFCAVLQSSGLIESAADFLRNLKHDKKTINACSAGLSIGEIPGDIARIKRMLAKRGALATRCAAAACEVLQTVWQGSRGLVAACLTDAGFLTYLEHVDAIIASSECYSLKGLRISGSDLIARGHPSGIGIGRTLEALLDHVIDNPEDNDYDTLLKIADYMKQSALDREGST